MEYENFVNQLESHLESKLEQKIAEKNEKKMQEKMAAEAIRSALEAFEARLSKEIREQANKLIANMFKDERIKNKIAKKIYKIYKNKIKEVLNDGRSISK